MLSGCPACSRAVYISETSRLTVSVASNKSFSARTADDLIGNATRWCTKMHAFEYFRLCIEGDVVGADRFLNTTIGQRDYYNAGFGAVVIELCQMTTEDLATELRRRFVNTGRNNELEFALVKRHVEKVLVAGQGTVKERAKRALCDALALEIAEGTIH